MEWKAVYFVAQDSWGLQRAKQLQHDYCVWETAITASECWSKVWLSTAFVPGWVEVPFLVAYLPADFTKLVYSKLGDYKAESPKSLGVSSANSFICKIS